MSVSHQKPEKDRTELTFRINEKMLDGAICQGGGK